MHGSRFGAGLARWHATGLRSPLRLQAHVRLAEPAAPRAPMLGELLPFVLPMAVALALRLWLASRNSGLTMDSPLYVRMAEALRAGDPAVPPGPSQDYPVLVALASFVLPGARTPGARWCRSLPRWVLHSVSCGLGGAAPAADAARRLRLAATVADASAAGGLRRRDHDRGLRSWRWRVRRRGARWTAGRPRAGRRAARRRRGGCGRGRGASRRSRSCWRRFAGASERSRLRWRRCVAVALPHSLVLRRGTRAAGRSSPKSVARARAVRRARSVRRVAARRSHRVRRQRSGSVHACCARRPGAILRGPIPRDCSRQAATRAGRVARAAAARLVRRLAVSELPAHGWRSWRCRSPIRCCSPRPADVRFAQLTGAGARAHGLRRPSGAALAWTRAVRGLDRGRGGLLLAGLVLALRGPGPAGTRARVRRQAH